MNTSSKIKMKSMDIAASSSLLAYSASAVATPICLIILSRELHLNLTEGGTIEAIRAILLVLVLLFSGFAASKWGKTAVMAVGGFILAAGLFFYGLAPSYVFILLAMVMVGLGGGFLEALINPLVQDLHPNDSGRYLNVVNAFWSIGVLATVLIVGELLTQDVSWRYIFIGIAGIAFVIAVFFLISSQKAHTKGLIPQEPKGNPLHHAFNILKKRHFWVFALAMICGGGVEGAYTFWSASYIQIYYETLPRAGAIGTAIFASGMIVGRMSGGLIRQEHLFLQIIISSVSGFIISLAFFWISSMTGLFILLFFAGLACACFWPSIQSYAVDRLKGESTMIFILLSAMGIPGFAIITWIMGRVGDIRGLKTSFIVIPLLFLLLTITILLNKIFDKKESGTDNNISHSLSDPL
jgi:fucose permease